MRPVAEPAPVASRVVGGRVDDRRCSRQREAWLSAHRADLVLIGALIVVAAVLRWPYLLTIPIWTDEGDEAQVALRIVRDGVLPLTNDNTYNGPLFNYVVAAALWMFGPSAWTPRLVTAALGTLAVVPTYLLGRELALQVGASARAGRLAGVMAALLLAVNAVHIVVNSHVGWGNCLTPLFTTTAAWLLARAFRGDAAQHDAAGDNALRGNAAHSTGAVDGPPLVLAGLALGLALQTHPTAAAIVPGVVLFGLWYGRQTLATPWPYLAGVAGVAGLSPLLLAAALMGPWVWVSAGRHQLAIYNFGEQLDAWTYVARLGRLLHVVAATLAGLLNDRATPLPPAWHPLSALAIGLAVAAIVWLGRRGRSLPAFLTASVLLVLPGLHGVYSPIISNSRYAVPLVPIVFAALAAWAVAFAASARRPGHDVVPDSNPRSVQAGSRLMLAPAGARVGVSAVARRGLMLGGLAVLAAGSLLSLRAYYDDAIGDGRTSEHLRLSYAALVAARQPDERVLLDRNLLGDWTLTEGRLGRVLRSWLELDGVPLDTVEVRGDGTFSGGLADVGGLIMLARGTLPIAQRHYDLAVIAESTHAAPSMRGYVIARATPRA